MQSSTFSTLIWLSFALVTSSVSGSREKRLVLDSETNLDLMGDIVKLREEVAKLQQNQISMETNFQAEMARLQQISGTPYVRWGKTSCPQNNGTSMVYKGYMAGKLYSNTGSGANSLCLPDDPTWSAYEDGSQNGRGYIYGTEFEPQGSNVFGKPVGDEDAPCAVCKIPGVSIMIPARADCYPGWKPEYSGYLMSHDVNQEASDYVCVDGNPEFIARGVADTNGHLLYLVEGRCGALVCPPYHDYRELACVVCSM